MKNIRKAGAKPKFKKEVKTERIHPLIPSSEKLKILSEINKICEPFYFQKL